MSGRDVEFATAFHTIASVPRLLIALDFDGTLSPTVDHPDDARASEAANKAISALVAAPDTRVALVSGRALESLARVARVSPHVTLVGSHGSEFRIDGVDTRSELLVDEREALSTLCEIIAEIAAKYDGAMAENKPAGCGLHTRLCTPDDARAAETEALKATGSMTGAELVSCRRGKDVLEFTVQHADKGTAISALRERFGAAAVLFIGDDVTDEDAFAVLRDGDVGIKVGDGATAAQYRVSDPEAVAKLLLGFAGIRIGAHRQ